MAKRFIDTEIWSEDWYLEMPNEYKLLWQYALDKADHAGIWRPNKVIFASICGHVDLKKAIELFNFGKIRVVVLDSGKWFFPGFFAFQYGTNFNENSKVHQSILKLLKTENLTIENYYNIEKQTFINLTSNIPQTNPIHRVKDKDKEKDKDKDKDSLKGGAGGKNNFQKPELFEIVSLFLETGSTEIEAQKFEAFYDSKNWMVGKSKMKNWKSAAKGWILRNKETPKTGLQKYTGNDQQISKAERTIRAAEESLNIKF